MAMRKKLDKAAFDKLASDELKGLYKLVGKDYVLDLEDDDDDDDPAGTTNAKTALERKHRKAAEKRLAEVEAELETLKGEKETATNGTAAIKASYDKKVAKLEKERDDALLLHKNYVGSKLKDETARDLAAKLNKDKTALLMPHLTSRLDVDYEGDEPSIVVLDAKGKKSAATLDDLAKEFRDNKEFAGIVLASQASGGGASRPGVTAPAGSAPKVGNPNVDPTQPVVLAKLQPKDLVAQVKARQAERAAAAQAAT